MISLSRVQRIPGVICETHVVQARASTVRPLRFIEHRIRALPARSKETLGPVAEIVAAVAEVSGVPVQRLKGREQGLLVARPRHVGMYVARQVSGHSLSEIGRAWGDRDRTTVRHACLAVANRLARGHEETVALVQRVREALGISA